MGLEWAVGALNGTTVAQAESQDALRGCGFLEG